MLSKCNVITCFRSCRPLLSVCKHSSNVFSEQQLGQITYFSNESLERLSFLLAYEVKLEKQQAKQQYLEKQKTAMKRYDVEILSNSLVL